MLDILETMFIWGLYVVLPAVLIIRHFGGQKTAIMLTAIFTFNTVIDYPQENQINSTPINSDLTTIILAKNDKEGRPQRFVPPYQDTGRTGTGRGKKDSDSSYNPNPQVRPGDPNSGGKYTPELSAGQIDSNNVPPRSDWETDTNFWDEPRADTCDDQDEPKLPVKVDYNYKLDKNGNPILYVPNIDSTAKSMKNRKFNRVEYDQTASHFHHAPKHGIPFPPGFDLQAFEKMSKAQRIAYAKQKVPREVLITYQNKLGQSMSRISGRRTVPVRGFAGTRKANVGLVFQQIPGTSNQMMTVIKDNGMHSTSYPITESQLKAIRDNDFWVLPTQPFN